MIRKFRTKEFSVGTSISDTISKRGKFGVLLWGLNLKEANLEIVKEQVVKFKNLKFNEANNHLKKIQCEKA